MKILAPVNKVKEIERIINEGADELYCGVLPGEWRARYTNVASPNRREWTSANLPDFGELEKAVNVARARDIPVYFTANAFYTQQQYPLILKQIEQAKRLGVDAFIIADIGLLLNLKEKNLDVEIHISNTGTTFNSETVKFYKELGASRIILPRQLMVEEIADLVKGENEVEFEVFILNSGCKNIDGFCTFHHGVNEVFHPFLWKFFKKLDFDRHLLELLRRLPGRLPNRIKGNFSGIDSACLLNYKISSIPNDLDDGEIPHLRRAISAGFTLLSGADPCGACELYRLKKIGINSVKIVGRNYSTFKKVRDVKFLRRVLQYLEQNPDISEDEFRAKVKAEYKNIYRLSCNNLCYRHS